MGPILDGLVGAVIGGVLTATATFLTVRWQTTRLLQDERDRGREAREDEHRDWLRRREEQALAGLLVVLNEVQKGIPKIHGLRRGRGRFVNQDNDYEAQHAYDALLHGLRVDLPLIAAIDVRQRYMNLVALIEELAGLAISDSQDVRERQRSDAIRYVGYVRHSVKRCLHAQSLPASSDPPVLTRNDGALWTPRETDPEDSYFPDPPSS